LELYKGHFILATRCGRSERLDLQDAARLTVR
jgi:hypothetical protein